MWQPRSVNAAWRRSAAGRRSSGSGRPTSGHAWTRPSFGSSPDLWTAVHARPARAREALPRCFHGGRFILGRSSYTDGASPYLLTGFTKCAICRGAVGSIPRAHGSAGQRTRVDYHGCFTSNRRGASSCSNNLQIRQDVLDHAVLSAIVQALDDPIIETAVAKALTRLRSGQETRPDCRTQIERELSLIEARPVEALVRGGSLETLVDQIRAEEERKKALAKELAGMEGNARVTSLDSERVKRAVRARAGRREGTPRPPQARCYGCC
jgi:hypothetical protein